MFPQMSNCVFLIPGSLKVPKMPPWGALTLSLLLWTTSDCICWHGAAATKVEADESRFPLDGFGCWSPVSIHSASWWCVIWGRGLV